MPRKKKSTRKTAARKTPARKKVARKPARAKSGTRSTKAATKKAVRKKASAKKASRKKAASGKAARKKAATTKSPASNRSNWKKVAATATGTGKTSTLGAARGKATASATSKTADNGAKSPRRKKRRPSDAPPGGDLLQRPGLPKPGSGGARTAAFTLREEPLTIAELRKVKTGLTRKELNQYRRLLLEKRAELLGDVESLGKDSRENGSGNLSHMPLHMADIGSDNYDQEFTYGLMESEAKMLREIHEALERMELRIYGVCLETGNPIERPRLDAKPWAKYCIEVVRELERLGKI